MDDGIIITTGIDKEKVSKYNENGFVSNLPNINEGRTDHGCSKYVNSDNKIVRYYSFLA